MVLLLSDSSNAVANSAAFVSVDESKYAIILAAAEGRKECERLCGINNSCVCEKESYRLVGAVWSWSV